MPTFRSFSGRGCAWIGSLDPRGFRDVSTRHDYPSSRRLLSYLSSSSDLDALIQQIKLSLHNQLASCLPKIGTKPNSFLRLPPPILVHIAGFLELQHRLSLAFACAGAKRALFAAPQLWNRAHPFFTESTSKESVPRILVRLIKLAQTSHFYPTLPLGYSVLIQGASLLVADDPRRVVYACQTVFREASSINLTVNLGRRWSNTTSSTIPSPGWLFLGSNILLLPNPKLETLSIRLTGTGLSLEADWHHRRLPLDMLGSNPGALTTLTLRGVSLFGALKTASPPSTIPALSNLRTFNYVAMGRTLGDLEVRFVLTMLPRLENLGLGFGAFELQPDGDVAQADIGANQIQRVGLAGFAIGGLKLLDFFHAATSIHAKFTDGGREPAHHPVRWIDCDNIHVQIRVESMMIVGRQDGRYFEFCSPWKRSHATILSPFFIIATRVTCITIREDCWEDALVVFPDMTSLRDMGIVLMTCSETRGPFRSPENVDTVFTWSPAEGQATAKFPALESLRFLAGDSKSLVKCAAPFFRGPCSCDNGCTFSLRDMMSFVHRILLPGQRIRRIVLHTISAIVDLDLASAMSDVLQVAEDLDVQFGIPPGTDFIFGDDKRSKWSYHLPAYAAETSEDDSLFSLSPQVRYDGTIESESFMGAILSR